MYVRHSLIHFFNCNKSQRIPCLLYRRAILSAYINLEGSLYKGSVGHGSPQNWLDEQQHIEAPANPDLAH